MLKKAIKNVDSKASQHEPIDNGMYEKLQNEIDTLLDQQFNDSIALTIINKNGFKLNKKLIAQRKSVPVLENVAANNAVCRKENIEDEDKEDSPKENIIRIKCKLLESVHNQNKTDYRKEDEMELETDIDLTLNSQKLDKQVGDLQSLLTMMAISSKEDDSQNQNSIIHETNATELTKNHTIIDRKYSRDIINIKSVEKYVHLKDIAENINVTPLKVQINEKHMVLAIKYFCKWKNYVAKNKHSAIKMQENKLNRFLEKLTKKKIDPSQSSNQGNKARLLAKDGMYQYRYKMQKHIIALQKAKLEEQDRIIEELKYNKIVKASKQSVDSLRDEVRKTYYDVDINLKPKLKFMANELKMEIEEPSLVLHCLKVPQFLQRMEKRAREREEKHAVIRERKKQMEEERQRLKQQAEVAKAEMDQGEQMKIMKDLREKRKREKIENIRKKQHAEQMRALQVMADLHYERFLKMKYGVRPLNILLEMKRNNIEKARAHFKFQLMKNVFLNWMWRAEDASYERNYKAEDFYRKKCLKKVYECLKKNTQELVLKKQVSEDYYDLYVVRLTFRKFREGIIAIKKEHLEKWQKAVRFYQSDLLFKTLTCWRALPALNAIQREQEARKERWRQKVLQVVPDYTPPDY